MPDAPSGFTVNHGTLIIPPGGLDLRLQVGKEPDGQIMLQFEATAGDTYRLHNSTNLTTWTPGNLIPPAPAGPVTVIPEPASATKGFWLIERLLP